MLAARTGAALRPELQRALGSDTTVLLQRFGARLERVALFGSRARGDAHEDSDVDVPCSSAVRALWRSTRRPNVLATLR